MAALSAFCSDKNALLTALRRLTTRQPESPGIVCLGAHMLHELDACDAGWALTDRFALDPTAEIAESISVGKSSGMDVIDSVASGPGLVLCPAGSKAWIDHAREAGRKVVIVMPLGSRLPARLWGAYLARNGIDVAADEQPGSMELIEIDQFDELIDPEGLRTLDEWAADCPDVAELARG